MATVIVGANVMIPIKLFDLNIYFPGVVSDTIITGSQYYQIYNKNPPTNTYKSKVDYWIKYDELFSLGKTYTYNGGNSYTLNSTTLFQDIANFITTAFGTYYGQSEIAQFFLNITQQMQIYIH